MGIIITPIPKMADLEGYDPEGPKTTKSWKDSPLGYADPTAAKRTKPKVKKKPIRKFKTVEAKGGGKIMYRSKGGKVFNGNDFVIQANNYKEM
jgi:hypothetical protein